MNAHWYFDFISPFSYLQLPKLREWRTRFDIIPVPIAFGALLAHNGNLVCCFTLFHPFRAKHRGQGKAQCAA